MAFGVIDILKFGLFVFLATVMVRLLITIGGHLYGLMLEEKAGVKGLRKRITRYSRLVNSFSERLEERREAAVGVSARMFASQRTEMQLKKATREAASAPYIFVRLVGREARPARPFDFMAFNSSVSHMVKRGERHAFYDNSWAYPLPVQVWASSLEDARESFERIFPRTLGFKVTHSQAAKMDLGMDAPTDGGDASDDTSMDVPVDALMGMESRDELPEVPLAMERAS